MKVAANRGVVHFGDFSADAAERRLTRNGVEMAIAPKTFDALLLLIENAGTLVERATLREKLWGGMIVEETTLARVIADIRKALDDVGEQRRYIATIPKFGYRFIAPVEWVSPVGEAESLLEPAPLEQSQPSGGRLSKWVASAAVVLAATVAVTLMVNGMYRPSPVRYLLISPFTIIGKTSDAEMLRFGIQDSLITELSGLRYLAVRGASAETGKSRLEEAILTGTVQLEGSRVRVNARLLKTSTGLALWSGSFEEEAGDVFRIESSIARQAVAAMLPTLSTEQNNRLLRHLNVNATAQRYYVLGRHYWNKRDLLVYPLAIEMFEKAAAADPSFAAPYTGMADTYLLMGADRTKVIAKARAALVKAIQIDPDFGEAHATLGLLAESAEFDWRKAEREFQAAIRLSPNYATAHHWYAEYLTMMGRFNLSESEFGIARDLDPLSPMILTDLAQCYNFRKDYSRSLLALTDVLQLESSFHLAHDRKGYALMLMGRPREALEEFQQADREAGRRPSLWVAAWAAAIAGRKDEARRLAEQSEQDEPSALMLAVILANLGDYDRAMDWLERAYDERRDGIVSVKVNPMFDPLRPNPRFKALLQKMNL